MRQAKLLVATVSAIVASSIPIASAEQPSGPSSKVAVPSPDAVPPLILTTKPRKDAADASDPTAEWMRRLYQSWLPSFRLTVAPFVRSVSSDTVTNGTAGQLKPKLPEPPAPFAPLDLPAKPPL